MDYSCVKYFTVAKIITALLISFSVHVWCTVKGQSKVLFSVHNYQHLCFCTCCAVLVVVQCICSYVSCRLFPRRYVCMSAHLYLRHCYDHLANLSQTYYLLANVHRVSCDQHQMTSSLTLLSSVFFSTVGPKSLDSGC